MDARPLLQETRCTGDKTPVQRNDGCVRQDHITDVGCSSDDTATWTGCSDSVEDCSEVNAGGFSRSVCRGHELRRLRGKEARLSIIFLFVCLLTIRPNCCQWLKPEVRELYFSFPPPRQVVVAPECFYEIRGVRWISIIIEGTATVLL